MNASLYRLEWPGAEPLAAYEPRIEEVERHAPALAMAYNDPYNGAMMAHTAPLTPAEVVECYADARRQGGRPFLLERGGALAGDADLRHIDLGTAEVAILIAARQAQGQGLGTRFAIMIHAFAAEVLRLERLYVSIIPANLPSQRLFARLGYVADESPEARRFAEAEDDVTLSLSTASFRQRFAAELGQIRSSPRA